MASSWNWPDWCKALQDDEALETYIKRAAVGVWHCSCSCRMGADDDPMAVTDNAGRVRGVHGLRVVDASIFPVVPCANTNFPTMMAGGEDRRRHAATAVVASPRTGWPWLDSNWQTADVAM